MTARPLPARARSLVIGVRAAGALVLAMVLASCSLLDGGNRQQDTRNRQGGSLDRGVCAGRARRLLLAGGRLGTVRKRLPVRQGDCAA